MTIALNRFRHDAANGTAFSSVRFFANVYYFFSLPHRLSCIA